jgi:hypothetical protein
MRCKEPQISSRRLALSIDLKGIDKDSRAYKLRHVILKLEKSIVELKAYHNPPQLVIDIMPVIFRLLGYKEKQVSVRWRETKFM